MTRLPNGRAGHPARTVTTSAGRRRGQSIGRPSVSGPLQPGDAKTRAYVSVGHDKLRNGGAVLDDAGAQLLTRRESPTEPPNYYIRKRRESLTPLTDCEDPTPQVRAHQEADGDLQARGRRAAFVYAVLAAGLQSRARGCLRCCGRIRCEYNDARTAGQVSGSTNRFTQFTGYSELLLSCCTATPCWITRRCRWSAIRRR